MINLEDAIEIFEDGTRIIPVAVEEKDDKSKAYNKENQEAMVIAIACIKKVKELQEAINHGGK